MKFNHVSIKFENTLLFESFQKTHHMLFIERFVFGKEFVLKDLRYDLGCFKDLLDTNGLSIALSLPVVEGVSDNGFE